MKLIVITGSKNLPDEPSIVTKMFEDGLVSQTQLQQHTHTLLQIHCTLNFIGIQTTR